MNNQATFSLWVWLPLSAAKATLFSHFNPELPQQQCSLCSLRLQFQRQQHRLPRQFRIPGRSTFFL